MTAIVEELGEVSQEVQLLEQIGTKAEWEKDPSTERLAEELTHLLDVIITLANVHEIDLDEVYGRKFQSE